MKVAKLCGFCPSVLGTNGELRPPNEADTTIKVASGHEFPICTDCLMDFHESLYNDWLTQQEDYKPVTEGTTSCF